MSTQLTTTTPYDNAITTWAISSTDPTSERFADLVRDKRAAITKFIAAVGKPFELVNATDIRQWQDELASQGKAPATIYAMVSRISAFYDYLLKNEQMANRLGTNPVTFARPKAPKAYQSESTKALDDHQFQALIDHIKAKADSGDVVGKRDYALALFYFLTGLRRSEVAGLTWGDIRPGQPMVVAVKVKGGRRENREIRDESVREALVDYLWASERMGGLQADTPLWTRHDYAGEPGAALTDHAISAQFKRYAKAVGIQGFHLHMARHTFARIVAEESGSMADTQDALGHSSQANTRYYVQRLGIKRDKFSGAVAKRLARKF